jgi:hypothetical protein
MKCFDCKKSQTSYHDLSKITLYLHFHFYYYFRIKSLQDELMEYNILENAIFVPISAKVGTNLEILKEKILDIVFKQKELDNQRYIEEDEWLKLEEEERINEAQSGQKEEEKEKVIEVDLIDDVYSLRNNSSSAGVLLDIVKSRKLGTTLHVVIRRGEVRLN